MTELFKLTDILIFQHNSPTLFYHWAHWAVSHREKRQACKNWDHVECLWQGLSFSELCFIRKTYKENYVLYLGLACPEGWFENGNQCYFILPQKTITFEGYYRCKQLNATLPIRTPSRTLSLQVWWKGVVIHGLNDSTQGWQRLWVARRDASSGYLLCMEFRWA